MVSEQKIIKALEARIVELEAEIKAQATSYRTTIRTLKLELNRKSECRTKRER